MLEAKLFTHFSALNNESTTGKNHQALTRKWEHITWVNPWAAPFAIMYYWFDTTNTWTGRYSTLQEEMDNTGCDPYLHNPKTLMFKGFTVGSIPGYYENGQPIYPYPPANPDQVLFWHY
jgi:hypothetical protein